MKNQPSLSRISPPELPENRSPLPKKNAAIPSLGATVSNGRVVFRVWAPQRKTVEVLVERPGQSLEPYALKKSSNGFFSGKHPKARVNDLYRYRVDGKNVYPDPASRFQPEGVHGPSQIVDSALFPWTDSAWRGLPLRELIVYELHVGAFTPEGTFEAVISRLPHLVELGVTAIELMPLADFPGRHNWGYDGVAPFAPARCYGVPDDLRRLVDAAHQAGLAVLVDVVYNHLGPDGNYTGIFSPHYMTARHPTPWGPGMNFDDAQSVPVREFFIENALQWVRDYHCDGVRLDATHAINDTGAQHFLADLSARVRQMALDRHVHVIAEDNRNLISLIRSADEGGMGLTAVWSDDFHHQVRRLLAGDHDGYYVDFSDKIEDLAVTLQRGWFYSGQQAPFFKAPRGTDSSGTPLERFVFFIQNHDQVGNRAQGDRLHQDMDLAVYRAASALLLTLPQTPLLFMGQEWAASTPFLYFTDHDEELGKAVTQGRKEEFKTFLIFGKSGIPDPQAVETFRKSKLNWSEKTQEPHESIWLFYRALLKWRREERWQTEIAGHFSAAGMGDSALILRRRTENDQTCLIVIQMKHAGRVDLDHHPYVIGIDRGAWDVVLTSEDVAYCTDPMPMVVHLAGEAPLIEFARPGAIILRERSKSK